MLSNIFQALDSLALTARNRTLHILFSSPDLNAQVFLQRIDGKHQLNEGFKAELICLSTSAAISLKQFIGSQVAIDQVIDQGQLTRTTGIITGTDIGQSDGSLTLYKLTVEDPTALFKYRRNSRVFMNKSVRDVTEILFKEWQHRSSSLASSLILDLSGLTKDYDIRLFIMQRNELDIDFIKRLLASEGISMLIDESEHVVAHVNAPIQAQKLRLIDDNSQYQALDRRQIRYNRSSAIERQDRIIAFTGVRSLQQMSVYINRWQADVLDIDEGADSVLSTHQDSDNHDTAIGNHLLKLIHDGILSKETFFQSLLNLIGVKCICTGIVSRKEKVHD